MELTYSDQPTGKPSFEELYELYQGRITGYLQKRVPMREVEDLSQDVWLRVARALPRFQVRAEPISAWLYRIAKNVILDSYRKAVNRYEYSGWMQTVDTDGAPDYSFLKTLAEASGESETDICDRLDAMERLNHPWCRDEEAAVLRGMGYTYAELEQHYGVKEGHARVLVYRGHQMLQGKPIR